LGWEVDTLAQTIALPPHRKARVRKLLAEYWTKRRISVKSMHKLLGELRSMALGIPGSAGLFSLLQQALTAALCSKNRVKLNSMTRSHIRDLLLLAQDVEARPTRIAELFPKSPAHVYGLCDASKLGFGGVYFASKSVGSPPIIWREPVPQDLQDRLVSDDNPSGDITNSDLELAGTLLHEHILPPAHLAELSMITGCDNTPAVAWRHKGSNSLSGPSSQLLRLAALHQRQTRHLPRLTYIPGHANVLADLASRRFDLTDSQLLQLFNSRFPQGQPWQMRALPPVKLSLVMSALRMQPPVAVSPHREHVQPTPSGPSVGSHFFLTSTLATRSSMASTTKSKSLGFLPSGFETAAFPVVDDQSVIHTYATRSFTSQRRSPNWGPQTPASQ
jgi:hypothetical protein